MQMPSINAQSALFGTAAAGLSLYGASDPGMSDRARVVTAGIASIFGAASAMSGFRVWAVVNAGIAAGTLAGIPLARAGSTQAADGAQHLREAEVAPVSEQHAASLAAPDRSAGMARLRTAMQ